MDTAPRHLTQRLVERLRPAAKPYAIRDTTCKGLMVVVQPSGRKSWTVQVDSYEETSAGPRLLGTRRRKIGEPATMDVSVARQRARELIGQLRRVQPPKAGTMKLCEAWALYVDERKRRGRAPRTIANYSEILERYLSDWAQVSLQEVFADRLGVVRLHAELSARGPVQANRVLRALRAVLRRARRLDPSLGGPPTSAVDQNPERRRSDRAPTAEQLREWWRAVQKVGNPVRRDAHLLSLLTGLRTGADGARGGGVGVVSLRWEHIDFDNRLIRLPTTKTGQPLIIPMSTQIEEVLHRRRRDNVSSSPFVFPTDSRTGHIASLREKTLPHFGHDMRAAYITHAEAAGVPRELVKRLVGHTDNTVTGGYVKIVTAIPASAHPGISRSLISDHVPEDDDLVTTAHGAIAKIHDSLSKVYAAEQAVVDLARAGFVPKSPADLMAHHGLTVERGRATVTTVNEALVSAGNKSLDAAAAAADAGMARLRKIEEAVGSQIREAMIDKVHGMPLQQEVRQVLRGMGDDNTRFQFAYKAAREGDVCVVAAISAAPPSLLGMSPAQVEQVKDAYLQKHHPVLFARRGAVQRAKGMLMAAGGALMNARVKLARHGNDPASRAAAAIAAINTDGS